MKLASLIEQLTHPRYQKVIGCVLCVAVSLVVASVSLEGVLTPLERQALDLEFRLRGTIPTHQDILLLTITNRAIQAVGPWPWARDWHATLTHILTEKGAKHILFDLIFAQPQTLQGDTAFEISLREAGNVTLAEYFEKGGERRQIVPRETLIAPHESFREAAHSLGHINTDPDSDGIFRRAPLLLATDDGARHPQLALQAALAGWGVDVEGVVMKPGEIVVPMDPVPLRIPIDSGGETLINWAGRWGEAFEQLSYLDVIAAYREEVEGETPRIDLGQIRGKICLVGVIATGLGDLKPIPLAQSYPGVGVHASILNMLLTQQFLYTAPAWVNASVMLTIGLLLGLTTPRLKPVGGALTAVALVAGYVGIAYLLFLTVRYWLAIVAPAITIVAAYLVVTIYNQLATLIERRRLFQLATRDGLTGLYNIRHFKLLLEAEFQTARKWKRELSLIMADIDHFKQFNDTYGHQTGDFILREVAHLFAAGARQMDIPARYGGEELIMLLPGATAEGVKEVAERIRSSVDKKKFRDGEREYHVTLSLGVATLTDEASPDTLIHRSDAGLYQAKEHGRNRIGEEKKSS